VALSDLDGDGRPDLVITRKNPSYAEDHELAVLSGNGDGSFGAKIGYGTAGVAGMLAIGDLNGDAKPDLVTITDANTVDVLVNVSPDWPTPTLLSRFDGDWRTDGIELRWRFADAAGFAEVALERAETEVGPWSVISGERREESGTVTLLDASVVSGHHYWYRLVATSSDGKTTTFGPLSVEAGAGVREFALAPVAPNPGQERVRFEFAVARATHVKLSVVDVQGRTVVRLEDRVMPPGRYQAVWEGTTGRERAPAGVYFARLEAGGQQWVQRFSLVR
jgi:hypothetical protein